MRPYISIDIETTGLNRERAEVLEIGVVADDLVSPIDKLPKKSILISLPKDDYAEPFALNMNAGIFAQLLDPSVPKFNVEAAFKELYDLTLWVGQICHDWDVKNTDPKWATNKVCFCGKNAATFDIPVLRNFFLRHGIDQKGVEHWMKHVHHRVMDVGSMYFPRFGSVPSLVDINKITGRTEVTHRAMEDAMDVVYAVRHIMGVPVEGKKN